MNGTLAGGFKAEMYSFLCRKASSKLHFSGVHSRNSHCSLRAESCVNYFGSYIPYNKEYRIWNWIDFSYFRCFLGILSFKLHSGFCNPFCPHFFMWVNAQVFTMGKLPHKIHIRHASGPSLLKSVWPVIILSSVVELLFPLSIELIESNIGNFHKPSFLFTVICPKKEPQKWWWLWYIIRTEWQNVHFVNYQAKMEAQRIRRSKAFLLYPQTVLTVNTGEDRCSAPSASLEASSLGEVGKVWSSLKLSWDNGAQELPLEKQCFERKHSALTVAVLSC